MNRFSLDQRTVWITGGCGHLGRAIATGMAEQGASVVLLDRVEAEQELHDALRDAGAPETRMVVTDLSDLATLRTDLARACDQVGRADVLINNAAFVGTSNLSGWAVPFEDQSISSWSAALDVNLSAPFAIVQDMAPLLRASGHGAILNIASIYAHVGADLRLYAGTGMGNPAAYGASKAGLVQLTRWLATALAPDIRVNSLSPGGIARGQDTSFVDAYEARTPLRRMAAEDDMVGAALLLCSDAGAYITGQNLTVDGGFTAW